MAIQLTTEEITIFQEQGYSAIPLVQSHRDKGGYTDLLLYMPNKIFESIDSKIQVFSRLTLSNIEGFPLIVLGLTLQTKKGSFRFNVLFNILNENDKRALNYLDQQENLMIYMFDDNFDHRTRLMIKWKQGVNTSEVIQLALDMSEKINPEAANFRVIRDKYKAMVKAEGAK